MESGVSRSVAGGFGSQFKAAMLLLWRPRLDGKRPWRLLVEILLIPAIMLLIVAVSVVFLAIRDSMQGDVRSTTGDSVTVSAWPPASNVCNFTDPGTGAVTERFAHCLAIIDQSYIDGVGGIFKRALAEAYLDGDQSRILEFESVKELENRVMKWTTQPMDPNCTDCISPEDLGYVVVLEFVRANDEINIDSLLDEKKEEKPETQQPTQQPATTSSLSGASILDWLKPAGDDYNGLLDGFDISDYEEYNDQLASLPTEVLGWRLYVPSIFEIRRIRDSTDAEPAEVMQTALTASMTNSTAAAFYQLHSELSAAVLRTPDPRRGTNQPAGVPLQGLPTIGALPLTTMAPSTPVPTYEPVLRIGLDSSSVEVLIMLVMPAFASTIYIANSMSLGCGLQRVFVQAGIHPFPMYLAGLTLVFMHWTVLMLSTGLCMLIRPQTFNAVYNSLSITPIAGFATIAIGVAGHLLEGFMLATIFPSSVATIALIAAFTIFLPGISPLLSLQQTEAAHTALSIILPATNIAAILDALEYLYLFMVQAYKMNIGPLPYQLNYADIMENNFPMSFINEYIFNTANRELQAIIRAAPSQLIAGFVMPGVFLLVSYVGLAIRPAELGVPARLHMLFSRIPSRQVILKHYARVARLRPGEPVDVLNSPVPVKDDGPPAAQVDDICRYYRANCKQLPTDPRQAARYVNPRTGARGTPGAPLRNTGMKFAAIYKASAKFDRGRIIGLIGVNGAGKTTMIKTLLGVERPSSGSVRVLGIDNRNPTALLSISPLIGYVPQHNIVDRFSCRLHCELAARARGVPGTRQEILCEADRCLEAVGLIRDGKQYAKAHTLSGGQKRRLMVAMAMVGRPALLILDEPSAGLSVDAKVDLDNAIRQAAQDSSVVLVEHDLAEVDSLATMLVIMRDGQVAAQGTSLTLKEEFGSGFTMRCTFNEIVPNSELAEVTTQVVAAMTKTLPGSELATRSGRDVFMVLPPEAANVFGELANTLETLYYREDRLLSSFAFDLPTLDDVFFAIAHGLGLDPAENLADYVTSPGLMSVASTCRQIMPCDLPDGNDDTELEAIPSPALPPLPDPTISTDHVAAAAAVTELAADSPFAHPATAIDTLNSVAPDAEAYINDEDVVTAFSIVNPDILAEAALQRSTVRQPTSAVPGSALSMAYSATSSVNVGSVAAANARDDADTREILHAAVTTPREQVNWSKVVGKLARKCGSVIIRNPGAMTHAVVSIAIALTLCIIMCVLYGPLIVPLVTQESAKATIYGDYTPTDSVNVARQILGNGVIYVPPADFLTAATVDILMSRAARAGLRVAGSSYRAPEKMTKEQAAEFIAGLSEVEPTTSALKGKRPDPASRAVLDFSGDALQITLPADYFMLQEDFSSAMTISALTYLLHTAGMGLPLDTNRDLSSLAVGSVFADMGNRISSYSGDSHLSFVYIAPIGPFYGLFVEILVSATIVSLAILMAQERESGLALLLALNGARRGENFTAWLITIGTMGALIALVAAALFIAAPIIMSPYLPIANAVVFIILSALGGMCSSITWSCTAATVTNFCRTGTGAAKLTPMLQWILPMISVIAMTVMSYTVMDRPYLDDIRTVLTPLYWIFGIIPFTHSQVMSVLAVFVSLYPNVFSLNMPLIYVSTCIQPLFSIGTFALAFKRDRILHSLGGTVPARQRRLYTPISYLLEKRDARACRKEDARIRAQQNDVTHAGANVHMQPQNHPFADQNVYESAAEAKAVAEDFDGHSDAVVVFDRARREYSGPAGRIIALRGLSLVVRKGECLGLVGENGAGKSTALGLAVGSEFPSSGSVRVRPKKVGFVPQTNAHEPSMTVADHIDLFATISGMNKNVAIGIARLCGLDGLMSRRPGQLSGGYKRRLQLALALITSTELLVADEVAAGVDIHAQRAITQLMDELKNAGTSLIVTSHCMDTVNRLANRVAILTKGRLRTVGTPDDLKQRYSQGVQVTLQMTPEAPHEDIVMTWLAQIARCPDQIGEIIVLPSLGGDCRYILPNDAPATLLEILEALSPARRPSWIIRAAAAPTTLQSVFLQLESESAKLKLANTNDFSYSPPAKPVSATPVSAVVEPVTPN